MEDDTEDDENAAASPVFYVVNPLASSPRRTTFSGISNLSALRLLNDVDIRRAPKPPQGTKRIRPPNRLVDHDGWQEVYSGKTVWIYDTQSNQDQCVRLVSQKGAAMYGTATSVPLLITPRPTYCLIIQRDALQCVFSFCSFSLLQRRQLACTRQSHLRAAGQFGVGGNDYRLRRARQVGLPREDA